MGRCTSETPDDPSAPKAETFMVRCELDDGHEGRHEAHGRRIYRWR